MVASYPGTLIKFGMKYTQRERDTYVALSVLAFGSAIRRAFRVEGDLIDHLFNSSEKRLARLLLLMANFGSDGIPQPIVVKVSQETLAEMIGTTRSRVSYFMNKFRKLGFISYDGEIMVHRSLLNAVLHEGRSRKTAA